MALVLSHRRNEGARITGCGLALDLIVRDFKGSGPKRKATMELLGLEDPKILHVDTINFYEIVTGLKIRICNNSSTNSVRLAYVANSMYDIIRKNY